jgi:hypothetical protein
MAAPALTSVNQTGTPSGLIRIEITGAPPDAHNLVNAAIIFFFLLGLGSNAITPTVAK